MLAHWPDWPNQPVRAFDQVDVQVLTRLRIFASLPPLCLQDMVAQHQRLHLGAALDTQLLGQRLGGSFAPQPQKSTPLQQTGQQVHPPQQHKAG